MTSLPLFPLNTVLFPGAPLDLYIFEERYKRMIQRCVEGDNTFGVCLIQQGLEAHGPLAEPHLIGCTARIVKYATLEDGKMLLQAIGTTRFRILSLRTEDSYWVGEIEPFPLQGVKRADLAGPTARLEPLVKSYLDELADLGGPEIEPVALPTDPLALAQVASVLLQVPQTEKQSLLAHERLLDLMKDLRSLYQRELPLLRRMGEQRAIDNEPTTFSAN